MEITRERLIELYTKYTNDEVCRLLGISKNTLIAYLKKLNIPLKGKGGKKKLILKQEVASNA